MGPFTDPEGSYYTRSASTLISKMRHVAAYLLAALSGTTPTADAVNNILASVGVEADPEALKIVMKKFEGQDIRSLIASGGALLASMPAGGVVGLVVAVQVEQLMPQLQRKRRKKSRKN